MEEGREGGREGDKGKSADRDVYRAPKQRESSCKSQSILHTFFLAASHGIHPLFDSCARGYGGERERGREGGGDGQAATHPASRMKVMTPMDHMSTGLP